LEVNTNFLLHEEIVTFSKHMAPIFMLSLEHVLYVTQEDASIVYPRVVEI
jgi:hypothetical protein